MTDRTPPPAEPRSAAGLARVPAPALVLGGVIGLEAGAAVAAAGIPAAGVVSIVTLRLGWAAIGFSALRCPRLPRDAATLRMVAVVGALLAGHHLCFYAAVGQLPLGVAVTLEFAGPLVVAIAGSRGALDMLWAGLAALGTAAVTGFAGVDAAPLSGVLAALGAGACWAGYIIAFPALGRRVGSRSGLALATGWAALAFVPYGLIAEHDRILTPHALLLGAAVALLSDIVAYSLQSNALTRMRGSSFSVLSSTEPAVAALFGLVALGQHVSFVQWLGMAAVGIASVGALRP